jgi:hypothetical protein
MKKLEIYIIAYNNLFCVEYQIKAFRSFCLDDYELIIIDSNCGEHHENTIRKKEMCDRYGIRFIQLSPELSLKSLNSTNILGRKLNYVYNNIVKNSKPEYFGFIDQDFFPFRSFSVIEELDNKGMYGDVCEMDGSKTQRDSLEDITDGPWVIHPWLSFYKYDFVKDFNLDFDSCHGFDTGGRNWEAMISKKNISKADYWKRHKTLMYFPFDEISNHGPAGYEKHFFVWNGEKIYSQVQIYDGKFIHMLNSKYLDDPGNPKTNWCKGFLDNAMLTDGILKFDENNGFHNEGPSFNI